MSGGEGNRGWMSYADVVRHICALMDCREEDAKRDLHDRILGLEIEARARRVEFKPAFHYASLPPSPGVMMNGEGPGWLRFIKPLKDYLTYRAAVHEWADDHISFWADWQKRAIGRPTGRIIATGIELSRADVLRLWPAEEGEERSRMPQSVSRRGRMLKHDWPKAAMFLANRIWRDDLKEPQAREVLKDWFAEKGVIPDDKDLRNWVSEFFEDTKKREK